MGTELGSGEFWERLSSDPRRLAAEVCLIDMSRLDEMLQRHPSLRAWINAAHEVARAEEERAKWELNKAKTRSYLASKKEKDPDTGKPKTVGVLEAEVEQDEEVQKVTDHLLSLTQKRAALRAMADALEDRKDMLIQIAAKRRAEMRDYS
jgi:hypothetical protein